MGRWLIFLLANALYIICPNIHAQILPSERLIDWYNAGLIGSTVPEYKNKIFINDFGAVPDGMSNCDEAIQKALTALQGQPGIILFDTGKYFFTKTIRLGDSVILRGQGSLESQLIFKAGSAVDFIVVNGFIDPKKYLLGTDSYRGSLKIQCNQLPENAPSGFAFLRQRDMHLMYSTWAYGSYAQLMRVRYSNSKSITSVNALRKDFYVKDSSWLQFVHMASGVGIENISIRRMDATPNVQTKNIVFNYASDCWVKGVDSDSCNFAHVDISYSMHIEVSNCYFHGAFNYGGGGVAYGVVLQSSSSHCLIENNIFRNLRHAVLLQSGSNANVVAYNYSRDPYWTSNPIFPNISGDIALHGNYPYNNLFEGNIVSHIWLDDSHGLNGPNNTFFRNRPYTYGIRMTNESPGQNFIGNEIPMNIQIPLMGNGYSLRGINHFEHANQLVQTIIPSGTGKLNDTSYYLNAPPYYWENKMTFPAIGLPNVINSQTSPSYERYFNQQFTEEDERKSSHTSIAWTMLMAKNIGRFQTELSVSAKRVEHTGYMIVELKENNNVQVIDTLMPDSCVISYSQTFQRLPFSDQFIRLRATLLNGEIEYSPWLKIPKLGYINKVPESVTHRNATGEYILYDLQGRILLSGTKNSILETMNSMNNFSGIYILFSINTSKVEKILRL